MCGVCVNVYVYVCTGGREARISLRVQECRSLIYSAGKDSAIEHPKDN